MSAVYGARSGRGCRSFTAQASGARRRSTRWVARRMGPVCRLRSGARNVKSRLTFFKGDAGTPSSIVFPVLLTSPKHSLRIHLTARDGFAA